MSNQRKGLRVSTWALAAIALVFLAPASALAQVNFVVAVDAENALGPDKLKVDAEGARLSSLTGDISIEYATPIDRKFEFPVRSSSVMGGVLTIVGGTGAQSVTVTIDLNASTASITGPGLPADVPGVPGSGGPRSFSATFGNKLQLELLLDASLLP